MPKQAKTKPTLPPDTLRNGVPRNRDYSHLKRGGKQAKTALSIPELEYCSWRAQGANISEAARYAGLPYGQGYGLERRPLVLDTINEMKEKFKADVLQRTAAAALERTEVLNNLGQDLALFVHGEYRHRMSTMVTHERIGDLAIAKMVEVGFKACGAIQPARVSATAGAQAGALAGNQSATALDVYTSQWMIEKRKQMAAQLEAKYGSQPSEPTSPPTINASR